MSMIWALLGTIMAVVFYVLLVQSKHKKLPPGPIGFPLFGSLHMLGKLPHHDFQKLAQKYGPIMHIRLGLVSTIIVSSPKTAELFLKTHDLVFASRPQLEIGKYINWDRKNILYSPYGSYWRNMRKMCTIELLSSVKISSFMAMRREELNLLINFVREASIVGDAINLSTKIASLTADMSCRMVLGKKHSEVEFDGKDFKGIIQDAFQIAAAPNLGDYIHFLAPFDLQGYTKRMKELHNLFDEFLDANIDEHVSSKDEDGRTKDFVDFMLSLGSQQSEYQIEKDNIKAVILDMLIASIESSSTSIEWTMSELMKNPRTLKTLQKELEALVGLNRMVEESDLENLEYLNMVVKENFRLHPPAPLLAPHEASEDCMVNGFHIPLKSHIYINIYAIGRDPNVWSDPETFSPERFMGSNNVDSRGRDFRLIPFGSGRRICPGMQLGHIVVKLCVAQLVHCFDWKLPNGMLCSELDMEEEFGLTTPRANHLLAIPKYRLKK